MIKPILLQALSVQATRSQERGDLDSAAKLYQEILTFAPSDLVALNNLGAIFYARGQFEQALALHDQSIAVDPGDAGFVANRVRALMQLSRVDEASASCETLVAQWPDYLPGWNMRGEVLYALRRLPEARDSYRHAVALRPLNYEALNNLGIIHCELSDYAQALENLGRALTIAPDSWTAHNNRGIALRGLGRFEEASASYERAQILNPDYAAAFYNQGDLFIGLRRYEEAVQLYDRAALLDPDLHYVRGAQLYARMQLCDWTGFDDNCSALLASVDRGEPATSPFPLLLLPSSPAQQLAAARHYIEQRNRFICPPLPGRAHSRLRVAYVSATFRHHPVMQLANGVFHHHDRERFEVFTFSLGPSDESAMRKRLEASFEHFIDAHALDDLSVAQMIREREIDVAIDLDGFTEGARVGVLAQRPAPVQASWLGYPGTMGAAHIDYIIADRHVVPPGAESGFGEKIVRLPFSFQPNSERPLVTPSSRTDAGLPADGFVFCGFNNLCKITPDVFAIWMRTLAVTPHSVLWLRDGNVMAQRNLARTAKFHGIAKERLIFAPHVDERTYYSRMMAADLFVDTFHYNAHTAASDALWAGLPVVTRAGSTFAGRVASSLLHAAGLPELVAETTDEYEELIIRLSSCPEILAQHRCMLADNRASCPLFDVKRFTHDFEAGIMEMVKSR